MKHLILPALALLGVLVWALTRGGEFDYLAAREDLLTEGPIVVAMDPGDAEGQSLTWAFFPGGAWVMTVSDPASSILEHVAFDGIGYRREHLPGCYVASPQAWALPPIPGVVIGALGSDVDLNLDRESGLLRYRVIPSPEGTVFEVSEDLSALRDGGGIRATVTGAGTVRWSLRAATEEEAAAARAILDARISETAVVQLRERPIAAQESRNTGWIIARNCPGQMVTSDLFSAFGRASISLGMGADGGVSVLDALPLSIGLGAPSRAIATNALAAEPGEAGLRDGALFAIADTDGKVEVAYEVLDCPDVAWLGCGMPLAGGAEATAARDALVAGAVVVDFATEFDETPGQRYTILPDGGWLLESLVSERFQVLFNGRQVMGRVAEGCYQAMTSLPLPAFPGLTFATSLESQIGADRSAAATTYAYEAIDSSGTRVTVIEDLAGLADGGGIAITVESPSGRQRLTIRTAVAGDLARVEAILAAARPSEQVALPLRMRLLDGVGIPSSQPGWVVLRDCPELVVGDLYIRGFRAGFTLGGEPISFVEDAVALDLAFEAPVEDLRAAVAAGVPEEVPLRPGLVFASGGAVVEVVACEAREWFACGE